jgi:hypothetical protein
MAGDTLATIANGTALSLNVALDSLWNSLEKSAAMNITEAAGGSLDQYTQIEQRAMLRTEMLNEAKGLDLASVLIKGRIVEEIRRDSLFSVHPAGYTTLEQLAMDQGVSIGELSQIVDLTTVIFPWVQSNLGMDVRTLWDSVGKSNMRELVPVLKRIITGEEARGSVEASYQRVMQEVAATAATAGETVDEEGLVILAARTLIDQGGTLTNANLRQQLRPDRMPSIEATVVRLDGRAYILAALDDRQEQFMNRKLHGYWDPLRMDDLTQEEALSVFRNQFPALDSFRRWLAGEERS